MENPEQKRGILRMDKALYMPNGSVRALLVILTSVGIMIMYAFNRSVPLELFGIYGTMVGFYFGSKTK
jgi:hypothetical protein